MSPDLTDRLAERLGRYRVEPTARQLNEAAAFIGHLAKWNMAMNLTALDLEAKLDDSLDRLIVEPFLAAKVIAAPIEAAVIDLGSGGGSPGIPLAIALSTTNLTLVESKAKKATFLRETIRHLGWPAARVIQSRMQEVFSDPAFSGSADVVSIRALAMEPSDWQGATGLLAKGGVVAWFRSADQEAGRIEPLSIVGTHNLTGVSSQLFLLGR